MTTGLYAADHASALADIRAAGTAVTFTSSQPGAYDPDTDTQGAPVVSTVAGYAIRTKGNPIRYQALELTQSEAPTLLFVPTTYGTLPAMGAGVTLDDGEYVVVDVDPVAPDGVPVMARVICRGSGDPSVLTSVTITGLTSPALVGDTMQLGATLIGRSGRTVRAPLPSWSSESPDVATVSSAGLVTAVSAGTTAIAADAGGQTDSLPLEVRRRWWEINDASATRVQYAGIATADFLRTSAVSGSNTSTAGRTFLSTSGSERVRQAGYVRQVTAYIDVVVPANGRRLRFIVFRQNGATYDVVGKSEYILPTATGTQTFDLATPIACAAGDLFGVWIEGGANTGETLLQIAVKSVAGTNTIFVSGEVADGGTGLTFPSTLSNLTMNIGGLGTPPAIVGTGDSIMAGHNGTTSWNPPMFETGLGDITNEILYQMAVGTGYSIAYQNAAKGSQTYAWVLSTGMPAALALSPEIVWIHCGVNDVAGARTWAAVEADLNAIRALSSTVLMCFDEILPWNAGSDAQAATIRTWNANLAAWVAAQTAPTALIECHDAMAQVRASTGQLDDMITAYSDTDNVHLSAAGVVFLADLAFPLLSDAEALL